MRLGAPWSGPKHALSGALGCAIEAANQPICELLLKEGADPNEWLDDYQNNALHLSAVYGKLNLCLFFSSLCSPAALTREGCTAFMLSCSRGHWDCARALARHMEPGLLRLRTSQNCKLGAWSALELARHFHGDAGLASAREALALGQRDELDQMLAPAKRSASAQKTL